MPVEELRGRLTVGQLAGWRWKETDGIVSADNLHPAGPVDFLYQYLLASKFATAWRQKPENALKRANTKPDEVEHIGYSQRDGSHE